MALPPGVEPLHVEDDQGAQDEHPDGAQAWHRPVLHVVAGVIGLLVCTIGSYQWGKANGINKGIDKHTYAAWEMYAIHRMMKKEPATTDPFWPVGANGIVVTKKKSNVGNRPEQL